MKKLIFLMGLAATMTLSSCLPERWATESNTRDYRYDNRQNPPPPPPRDNRYDNRYDNRGGGYGYDSRYDNRNYRGYQRPPIGTEVTQLPGSARRVVSNGQEIYICNGVMYQPSRSRMGVVYRVVGYSDY